MAEPSPIIVRCRVRKPRRAETSVFAGCAASDVLLIVESSLFPRNRPRSTSSVPGPVGAAPEGGNSSRDGGVRMRSARGFADRLCGGCHLRAIPAG
ncbi:hypothetical protein GCM10022230_11670 [Pseudoclavibacter caeni]